MLYNHTLIKQKHNLCICVADVQSVTKLVDRLGVNGNNPPSPLFNVVRLKIVGFFHVILGCNALSIVLQQMYATLKWGRGFHS